MYGRCPNDQSPLALRQKYSSAISTIDYPNYDMSSTPLFSCALIRATRTTTWSKVKVMGLKVTPIKSADTNRWGSNQTQKCRVSSRLYVKLSASPALRARSIVESHIVFIPSINVPNPNALITVSGSVQVVSSTILRSNSTIGSSVWFY